MKSVDDIRICDTSELVTPRQILEKFPITPMACKTTFEARREIEAVLDRKDSRLVVIVGPCSIHDPRAALEYAEKLVAVKEMLSDELIIVMRTYFEKPRTTIGWKGLINDPDLDGSHTVNKGLGVARKVLIDINNLGMPAGCEYLDLITPQYTADIVAWGAIGARTTESQCHRELASGLSSPVGFKNGTSGNCQIAVDAIDSARHPHHFLSVTKEGNSAVFTSTGNDYCHIVLRGGKSGPNYFPEYIEEISKLLRSKSLSDNLMVDCSHANSYKTPSRQVEGCNSVCSQLDKGEKRIIGVMIESNLVGGRQDVVKGKPLKYGQSITDGCISWDETVRLLEKLSFFGAQSSSPCGCMKWSDFIRRPFFSSFSSDEKICLDWAANRSQCQPPVAP